MNIILYSRVISKIFFRFDIRKLPFLHVFYRFILSSGRCIFLNFLPCSFLLVHKKKKTGSVRNLRGSDALPVICLFICYFSSISFISFSGVLIGAIL